MGGIPACSLAAGRGARLGARFRSGLDAVAFRDTTAGGVVIVLASLRRASAIDPPSPEAVAGELVSGVVLQRRAVRERQLAGD